MPVATRPWQLHVPPGAEAGPVIVSDGAGQPIATLHGPREQAMLDGVLIANAPALLRAVRYSLEAFSTIAEEEGAGSVAAAQAREYLRRLLDGPAGVWRDGERGR